MPLAFAWLSVRGDEDCVLLSEYRGRESRVCSACSRLDRTSRYRLRAGRLARWPTLLWCARHFPSRWQFDAPSAEHTTICIPSSQAKRPPKPHPTPPNPTPAPPCRPTSRPGCPVAWLHVSDKCKNRGRATASCQRTRHKVCRVRCRPWCRPWWNVQAAWIEMHMNSPPFGRIVSFCRTQLDLLYYILHRRAVQSE